MASVQKQGLPRPEIRRRELELVLTCRLSARLYSNTAERRSRLEGRSLAAKSGQVYICGLRGPIWSGWNILFSGLKIIAQLDFFKSICLSTLALSQTPYWPSAAAPSLLPPTSLPPRCLSNTKRPPLRRPASRSLPGPWRRWRPRCRTRAGRARGTITSLCWKERIFYSSSSLVLEPRGIVWKVFHYKTINAWVKTAGSAGEKVAGAELGGMSERRRTQLVMFKRWSD